MKIPEKCARRKHGPKNQEDIFYGSGDRHDIAWLTKVGERASQKYMTEERAKELAQMYVDGWKANDHKTL